MNAALPAPKPTGVGGGVFFSAVLHTVAIVAMFVVRPTPRALPAVARIEMVAAAVGDPTIGVVQDTKTETTEPAPNSSAAPIKSTKKAETKPKRAPLPEPKRATANTPKVTSTPTKAPTAAGGEVGGKGADLVSLNIKGVANFPDPGYLTNIVNQVRAVFRPAPGLADSATLSFRIMRDGSIESIEFVTRAPHSAFNREALGAIEAVGNGRRLGPLPGSYKDDALFVVFTFDPKFYRK